MKFSNKIYKTLTLIILFMTASALCAASTQLSYAAFASPELDYTFETVPIETITLTADGVKEIQPRQSFVVYFQVTPWYTTTADVYIDILPEKSAIVTEISELSVSGGKAIGSARITVSESASVGSTFKIIAGTDGIESNALEIKVGKIPVTGFKLTLEGNDGNLHVGKTRRVISEFTPSYATVKDVRYELTGNGMKYIERFDEASGVIKARNDISLLDVNSTVTIKAYSVDNPNAFDSVTLTLFMPTTIVDISADTPRNRMSADGKPLAVAASAYGDTVTLRSTINGVEASGLNYVIVSGQEYVENGYVQSNGTFTLRPTAGWSQDMRVPHAEITIRAAYSDGFDEIAVSVYVPVERIEFVGEPPEKLENSRSYNMKAEGFPKYATLLNDNEAPVYYSLNGLSSDIAALDSDGTLTLPKSLTSKGRVVNYSALLTNSWEGVDASPLNHSVTIAPVYANGFKSIKILKDGMPINTNGVKVIPSDVLSIEAEYTIDNVTEVDFNVSADSSVLTVDGYTMTVADISAMANDNPFIYVTAEYSCGGEYFSEKLPLSIYVPALSAEISDAVFKRGETLDLNKLITINGHGHASDKSIKWGEPTASGYTGAVNASCANGNLFVNSTATAGTVVKVPYMTADVDSWQYKEFTVAALDGRFELQYGQTFNSIDSRRYDIDPIAPELEEGQSVSLIIKYNGLGGALNYGLSYTVSATNNATLKYSSGSSSSDSFTLTAKAGESGRNNYIGYVIEIRDGTATYCIRTNEFGKPSGASIDLSAKSIAVFNRISGTIGIMNDRVVAGDVFQITGWDESATFNIGDLKFIVNGKTLDNKTMIETGGAFVLKLQAVQTYNGQIIAWSAEYGYSVIHYKDGDSTLLNVYKKYNSTIKIEGAGSVSKESFTLTGWATDISANKKSQYGFGSDYSNNSDLTLWACWLTYGGEKNAGTLNYEGKDNFCYYDIRIGSDSVDGTNYNYKGFNVHMLGISCTRNIFTTFKYVFTFKLYKGGVLLAEQSVDIFINDKDKVPNMNKAIFSESNLSGAGDYKLEWSGYIKSNVTVDYSSSYEFKINEC